MLFDNYAIETEEIDNGWRWRYTSLTDGADRYSAKKFSSEAECAESAVEHLKKYKNRVSQIEQKLLLSQNAPIFDSPD